MPFRTHADDLGLAHERGASAVEFAIVLSVLMLLVFGIVQFGILFNVYQGLQAGGREGARLGSLPATDVGQIETRVANSVSLVNMTAPEDCALNGVGDWCVEVRTRNPAGTLSADLTSSLARPCNTAAAGTTVVVKVTNRRTVDIPLWAAPTINVSGSGEFKCEGT